jgi:hypothetical protein
MDDELEMPPRFWAAMVGVVVLDPDGWRRDGKDFDEPLTLDDFWDRMLYSTIYAPNGVPERKHT